MIYDVPVAKGTLKQLPLVALGLVIALVVSIEIMIFDGYRQLRANTDEMRRSQEIVLATENVLRSVLNTETGERGFVIAADEAFLEPYRVGRDEFATAIKRAIELALASPEQQARLEEVGALESQWRTQVVEPLTEKRRSMSANVKLSDAQDIVRRGLGKTYVDQIRRLLTEVERVELTRSAMARTELETYFRTSTTMVMTGSAVVLLLVITLSATLAGSVRRMARINRLLEIEVSERKAAESSAQTARDRLDLALEGAGLALWDYDIVRGDVYLGAHWNEMLGGAHEEKTTSITELPKMMHPEDAPHVIKLVREVVRGTSDSYRAEHRVQMISGEWKWIESHGKVVVRDKQGLALCMTGINADISERKQVERLKNEFVATVSHELRMPLTAILGGLGMIKDKVFGDIPADARTLLEMAYKNGERLRDLINNILDIEKMESGVMDYKPASVDVVEALQKAAGLNQAYAHTFSVRFEVDLPADRPFIHADPDRLLQVLTNLLSNAAKFSPRNGVVTLSCRSAGDYVRIEIRDRGPGILQDFRARIFSKFAQADSSDTRQKAGTGLGLSIAKAIVQKMRGHIDYASEPDRGTVFFVEFPRHADPATAAQPDHLRSA